MAEKPITEYFAEIMEFCYKFVIKGEKESRNTIIEGSQKTDTFKQFDFVRTKKIHDEKKNIGSYFNPHTVFNVSATVNEY